MNQTRRQNSIPRRDCDPSKNVVGRETGGGRRRQLDDVVVRNKTERVSKRRDHSAIVHDIPTLKVQKEKLRKRRDQSVIVNETIIFEDKTEQRRRRRDHSVIADDIRVPSQQKHNISQRSSKGRKSPKMFSDDPSSSYSSRSSSSTRSAVSSGTRSTALSSCSSSSSASRSKDYSPRHYRKKEDMRTEEQHRRNNVHEQRRNRNGGRSHTSKHRDHYNQPGNGLPGAVQDYLAEAFSSHDADYPKSDDEIEKYLQTCFEKEFYLRKEFYQRRAKQGHPVKSDKDLAQDLQQRIREEFERDMRKTGNMENLSNVSQDSHRHSAKKCVEDEVEKCTNGGNNINIPEEKLEFYKAYPNLGSALLGIRK